jgi:pyruvate dehydrogenase (quinone)
LPPDSALDQLADFLNKAERVTLLCGSGCAGSHDELMQLAEILKSPIVHAMRGKEHVEWDNPYDVGMTGLIGFASDYHAMESCDALLMLGTDFPYRQFYQTGADRADRPQGGSDRPPCARRAGIDRTGRPTLRAAAAADRENRPPLSRRRAA